MTATDGPSGPGAARHASDARRLRDACEPVAMHAVWSPSTTARLAAAGLDFLAAYVAGRAASLGDPSGPVVAAVFAWFEPGLIASQWERAHALVRPDVLTRWRDEATSESLAAVLAGGAHGRSADVAAVADALADAAEPADGTGRPLFSGLRARGRPADPVHRLWWACDLVREHRGDSHVAVANAAGIDPVEMNVLTELWVGMPLGSYTATRGWPEARVAAAVTRLGERGWVAGGRLTPEGSEARVALEAATDGQEAEIVAALGDHLDGVCDRLDGWGLDCIAAGAFPDDPRKRAAG